MDYDVTDEIVICSESRSQTDQTEMVWTWIHLQKDDEAGTARQETKEEIYGCSERGHEAGWCERRG